MLRVFWRRILGLEKYNKAADISTLIYTCDDLEPITVKALDFDEIQLLSAEEAKRKQEEFKVLFQENHKRLNEIARQRARMPKETDEELEAYERKSEKLHAFVDAERKLKEQIDAFAMQYYAKAGFRKKENEHLLKEYAEEDTSFWKFSQSKAGTAGEAGVFAEYIPGQIVESVDKDCLLSFVRAKDLYKCWRYGDQITKLCFDLKDPGFQEIKNYPAYEMGNLFGEIKTDYLLPEDNFSLSSVDTIRTIIDISGENRTHAASELFILPGFKDQMERFGFKDTVSFIDYVNRRSEASEDRAYWIGQNFGKLCEDWLRS